ALVPALAARGPGRHPPLAVEEADAEVALVAGRLGGALDPRELLADEGAEVRLRRRPEALRDAKEAREREDGEVRGAANDRRQRQVDDLDRPVREGAADAVGEVARLPATAVLDHDELHFAQSTAARDSGQHRGGLLPRGRHAVSSPRRGNASANAPIAASSSCSSRNP